MKTVVISNITYDITNKDHLSDYYNNEYYCYLYEVPKFLRKYFRKSETCMRGSLSFSHILYHDISTYQATNYLKRLYDFIERLKLRIREYINGINILKLIKGNRKNILNVYSIGEEVLNIIIYNIKQNLIKSSIYQKYLRLFSDTLQYCVPLRFDNLLFLNHYKDYISILMEEEFILSGKSKHRIKEKNNKIRYKSYYNVINYINRIDSINSTKIKSKIKVKDINYKKSKYKKYKKSHR